MDSDGRLPLYQRPEFKDAARAAILRVHIDQVCAQIVSGQLTRCEAEEKAARITKELEQLIGSDRELFECIYGSRMRRLIKQFTLPDEGESTSF